MKIILQNNGEIDLDVIKIMGVNVKEDDNAIGFFGTGLKYAIAVLLREGIGFRLFSGASEYEFYTEPKVIRDKTFNVCAMRGPYDYIELGFTTDLGKNWELWQAYREIHSNCLDEGGEIFRGDRAYGAEGKTVFEIDDMDTGGIFLADLNKKRLFRNHRIEIYEGPSDHVYYRGIRAKDLKQPSKYTYNVITHCALTEDRLLSYDWEIQHAINDSLAEMGAEDKELIAGVLLAGRDSFESTLSMRSNSWSKPGPAFLEVYAENKNKVGSSVREYVTEHTPKVPLTPEQRRQKIISELQDFCSTHGLTCAISEDSATVMGL